MGLFAGKGVLVTGGARGIGRAIAQAFAREGALVALCDLRPEGKEVAEAIGGAFFQVDLEDERERVRFVEEAAYALGRVDVLVNNAAIAAPGSALTVRLPEWRRVLEVNLTAPMHLSALAAREMRKVGGGAIVNVASVQGLFAEQENAAYNASKGGLVNLTRSLALDLAPLRIRPRSQHAPAAIHRRMVHHLRVLHRRHRRHQSRQRTRHDRPILRMHMQHHLRRPYHHRQRGRQQREQHGVEHQGRPGQGQGFLPAARSDGR